MTAANNGTGTPEDDDPFGYLYEDGRAAGAQPPSSGGGYGYPSASSQRGVPRTSYNQVRPVGERQYGQQGQGQQGQGQATQAFPQQGQPGQQQYGQPNAHYAAPETQPGGAPRGPAESPGDQGRGGRGRGPNTRGLLIGAIAVVAAVVIGIGVALINGKDKPEDKASGKDGATSGQQQKPSPTAEPTEGDKPPTELPKSDAALLMLSPGLSAVKDVPGATSDSKTYVPLSQPNSSATWTVKVPEAGQYKLSVDYGVPGRDTKADLTVNGKPHQTGLRMKNFANAQADAWDKGWTNTWAQVSAKQGENTFVISCPAGCEVNLDRVALQPLKKQ
ncbi:carbohydrate-binding protein [Streptomyces sp. NBC_00237]|uniref:carbohydrate-binding protein n=1 Tax=Streptomyces sp. NBC_00237 TaxID=2975687 RepID=UPI00225401FA|nr:carbohydrate-binding protein [Streptomyces sp. NBC_00237]MCX5200425.1 carbohydrate-binding protein [Streptomyces sp. NBC_00237]